MLYLFLSFANYSFSFKNQVSNPKGTLLQKSPIQKNLTWCASNSDT